MCGSVTARTITVEQDGSGDFATIQTALYSATEGDTVSIGPGRYLDSGIYDFSGGEWPVRVYACVQVASLTILGAGADETVIGPEAFVINPEIDNYGIVIDNAGGTIVLRDISIVNCFMGLSSSEASQGVDVANCRFSGNEFGVYSDRMHGHISYCTFTGGEVDLLDRGIFIGNGQTAMEVSSCYFSNLSTAMSIGPGANASNVHECTVQDVVVGINLWSVEEVTVVGNNMTAVSNIGIAVEGLDHVIRANDIESSGAAMAQYNTLALIEQNRFSSSGYSAVYITARPPYLATYVNNDLSRTGSATLARIHVFSTDEPYRLSMLNHYWGYTVADSIEAWILDGKDDPEELGIIDIAPFATQSVENENRSMGELKSMFR